MYFYCISEFVFCKGKRPQIKHDVGDDVIKLDSNLTTATHARLTSGGAMTGDDQTGRQSEGLRAHLGVHHGWRRLGGIAGLGEEDNSLPAYHGGDENNTERCAEARVLLLPRPEDAATDISGHESHSERGSGSPLKLYCCLSLKIKRSVQEWHAISLHLLTAV